MSQAVFDRDGEWLVPSKLAGGPWNPEAQHGGAVAGLLAWSVEPHVPEGMRVTRLAIDLLGEVPMAPLCAQAEVVRKGSRIQLVDARLFAGERTLARATAQLVRAAPVSDIDEAHAASTPPPPRPEVSAPPRFKGVDVPGWIHAVEFLRGPTLEDVVWTRLKAPLVEGHRASPFVQLAALSDFSSGTRNPLDFTRYVSINPDLTLHVLRPPRSEWICIDGETSIGSDGTGQSSATLYDEQGPVARSLASLYVAARA